MKRDRLPEIALLVVVFCAIAAVALALANLYSPFGPPPTLQMQVGDPLETVRVNSTFPVLSSISSGFSTNDQLVTFVYGDSAHRLELPGLKGLYFELVGGRVSYISISSYTPARSWEETAAAARLLSLRLEKAGWTREDPAQNVNDLLTRVRAYYDNPTFQNGMNEDVLGAWFDGDTRLEVSFYRLSFADPVTAGPTPPPPPFSLSLSIRQRDR